jgi:hypothetical protein
MHIYAIKASIKKPFHRLPTIVPLVNIKELGVAFVIWVREVRVRIAMRDLFAAAIAKVTTALAARHLKVHGGHQHAQAQ